MLSAMCGRFPCRNPDVISCQGLKPTVMSPSWNSPHGQSAKLNNIVSGNSCCSPNPMMFATSRKPTTDLIWNKLSGPLSEFGIEARFEHGMGAAHLVDHGFRPIEELAFALDGPAS